MSARQKYIIMIFLLFYCCGGERKNPLETELQNEKKKNPVYCTSCDEQKKKPQHVSGTSGTYTWTY